MANKRLNDKDIDELLAQYRSERRRLSFQLERVREAIKELRRSKSDAPSSRTSEGTKRGPGRPRKAVPAGARRIKPTKRKKRTVVGGYRLSDWDNAVIDSIKKADRLLPKEDILKAITSWARKAEPEMSPADVEAKLTRVLQKLSGKRGELGTHRSGLRRGYHYGLKDWFFASSGALRKQHYEKLVLVDAKV